MSSVDALYARVSTGRQEQERTIESQLDALRARAGGSTGLALRVFRDDGYSGARLDRPGLDALRDASADGEIRTLYVFDPDRLARNFVHQQVLLEEFERRGVVVVFVQRPLSDRPEDRLLAQMQGAFAEYERTKIVERTRRGKLYKARLGLFVWPGPPAYGFRITRGPKGTPPAVSHDEREASWVRKMFQWVIEEGFSARQVAKRLNRLGVEPRRGACWNQGTVQGILRNSAYAGTVYYNRKESAEPRRRRNPTAYPRNWKSSHRLRPREEWIPVPVPALISSELQERALAEIRTHRWKLERKTLYPFLLRALVHCGKCGRRMEAMTTRSKGPRHTRGGREWYPYYECPRTHHSPEDTGHLTKCDARRVRADRLDEVVWQSLGEFLRKPEVLKVEIATYAEGRRTSSKSEESEDKRLGERVRQLERQRSRLVDAFQAGLLDVKELRLRGERLEVELGEVRRRQEELGALRASGARADEVFREVEVFCARLRQGFDRLTFEERVRVVKWLVERVVVKEGEVTVEHVIPLQGRYRRETSPPGEFLAPPKDARDERRIDTDVTKGSPPPTGKFGGMWLADRRYSARR
jgi:site-specific DNA recombinase